MPLGEVQRNQTATIRSISLGVPPRPGRPAPFPGSSKCPPPSSRNLLERTHGTERAAYIGARIYNAIEANHGSTEATTPDARGNQPGRRKPCGGVPRVPAFVRSPDAFPFQRRLLRLGTPLSIGSILDFRILALTARRGTKSAAAYRSNSVAR